MTHSPVQPRYFGVFFLWETSGWVNMEEPRVNKIPANAGASQAEADSTSHPRLLWKRLLRRPYLSWFPSADEGNLQELFQCTGHQGCLPEDTPSAVRSEAWPVKLGSPGRVPFQIHHWIQINCRPSGRLGLSSWNFPGLFPPLCPRWQCLPHHICYS